MALYRFLLGFFIFGLIISGLTAFPLLMELTLLCQFYGIEDSSQYQSLSGLAHWVAYVHYGLEQTYARYPFVAYGTDWLAFGHIVIALFFFKPLFHPFGNEWVLKCGILACLGVIPLALICGNIREIPIYWQLIDMSFGVLGMSPLFWCLFILKRLQASR